MKEQRRPAHQLLPHKEANPGEAHHHAQVIPGKVVGSLVAGDRTEVVASLVAAVVAVTLDLNRGNGGDREDISAAVFSAAKYARSVLTKQK